MKLSLTPQNKFIKLLTLLSNIIILNLLFILTSIPIFTIGASITASYRAIFDIMNEPTPSVFASYVKSFRQNFVSATLLWLPLVFLSLFFTADCYVILFILGEKYKFFLIPVFCMFYVLASVLIYAFPLLARYDTTGLPLVKNALLLSLSNVPTTVFILVICLAVGFYASLSLVNLATILLFALIFGCALLMYLFAFFLFRIFEKCQ